MLVTNGSQAMLSQKLRLRKSPSAGNYDNLKTAFIDNLAASTKHVAQTANVINYSSNHSPELVRVSVKTSMTHCWLLTGLR